MRLAVLGPRHEDSFSSNIAETCLRSGIDVIHVDTRGPVSRRYQARYGPRILRAAENVALQTDFGRKNLLVAPATSQLRDFNPDVVLSTNGYLRPDDLRIWRASTNAIWALWYPDALANLGAQDALAAQYDALFFKDPHLVDRLSSMTSLPVYFLPEACNPERHRPHEFASDEEAAAYACDVTLAGHLYAYRIRVLEQLDVSLNLRLYGYRVRNIDPPKGTFTGRYVTGREKSLAFRGAKVLLNTLHYGEIDSMNARLFEAAGCGAFIVTEWRSSLAELFEDGKEVMSFRTAAELNKLLSEVLSWPASDRDAVAEAARIRAHRDHSYEKRLDDMFKVLGLKMSSMAP